MPAPALDLTTLFEMISLFLTVKSGSKGGRGGPEPCMRREQREGLGLGGGGSASSYSCQPTGPANHHTNTNIVAPTSISTTKIMTP